MVRALVLRFSVANRRRKARMITEFMRRERVGGVVLVGSGGLVGEEHRNVGVVERAVAAQAPIRLAIDLAPQRSPWDFVRADGCALPLADRCVDLVLANAVIEHVGGREAQARFVAEQTRVARHWVITTPNRWFPVESHTSAVFRHWSGAWRDRQIRFTRLLSLGEFRALLPPGSVLVGRPWSATFTAFYSAPEVATAASALASVTAESEPPQAVASAA